MRVTDAAPTLGEHIIERGLAAPVAEESLEKAQRLVVRALRSDAPMTRRPYVAEHDITPGPGK